MVITVLNAYIVTKSLIIQPESLQSLKARSVKHLPPQSQ